MLDIFKGQPVSFVAKVFCTFLYRVYQQLWHSASCDLGRLGKVDAALLALTEKEDFVLVHIEAQDEARHEGLVQKKKQANENFDARTVKSFAEEKESSLSRFLRFTPVLPPGKLTPFPEDLCQSMGKLCENST